MTKLIRDGAGSGLIVRPTPHVESNKAAVSGASVMIRVVA
jgi:hypothetical protein